MPRLYHFCKNSGNTRKSHAPRRTASLCKRSEKPTVFRKTLNISYIYIYIKYLIFIKLWCVLEICENFNNHISIFCLEIMKIKQFLTQNTFCIKKSIICPKFHGVLKYWAISSAACRRHRPARKKRSMKVGERFMSVMFSSALPAFQAKVQGLRPTRQTPPRQSIPKKKAAMKKCIPQHRD